MWRAAADEWIYEQVARLGAGPAGVIEQLHIRPWATVMRVPTMNGDIYFKASTSAFRHEAALVTLIAARRPDCIPPLLAVAPERGWMLMADAGTRLRELIARERELTRWLDVLPLYAEVQIDLAGNADELIALGVPDLRLATVAWKFEEMLGALTGLPAEERRLLDDAVPRVGEMCRELAAYGLPETIQHDDFHDGQVFFSDGRYLILDWGDACISHPFFTMAVTLDGQIAWGVDDIHGSVDVGPFRDAYLRPFARIAGSADLAAACQIGTRLGWICRAVNGHLTGSESAKTRERLRMFLDGQP